MTIHRHFEMIYMLLERKVMTAKELATHFEVSTRTIYRDLDVLSGAGIPIYTNRGKGGGISLLDGYSFDASLLTEAEQNNILMALQTLEVTEVPGTEQSLRRVAKLFKKKVPNWIEVNFSPWGSDEKKNPLFHQIRDAIMQQLVIQFHYVNNNGEKSTREAEPLQLLFKHHAWYLSGYCLHRHDHRIFKVSRMDHVEILAKHFTPKLVPQVIKNAEEQIGASAEPIKLQFTSQAAYRIYDEFSEQQIAKHADGSYTVEATFPIGTWLDNYLLSFGELLQGVYPNNLRERLLKKLEEMRGKLS